MPKLAKDLDLDSIDERQSTRAVTPVKAKPSKSKSTIDNGITPQKELGRSDRIISTSGKKIIDEFAASPKKGAFGRTAIASLEIPTRVTKIYKEVRKATGALGGNGYDGAIYGEITMHSMQKIVNLMVERCGLTSDSRFIDVGSGLGKPNFHVAQYPGVRLSIGIELETIRWKLALHNLAHVLPAVSPEWTDLNKTNASSRSPSLYGGVNFLAGDMDDAASTDPFTHIYQYDLGFPPPLHRSIAEKFNTSKHAEYLISYRVPHRILNEYGYEVELVDQISTNMHGSGEVHTCYFYKRLSRPPASMVPIPGCSIVTLPPRPGTDDKPVDIFTADLFKEAVVQAAGNLEALKEVTGEKLKSFLDSGRPKRDRRPRVLDGQN